MHLGAIRDRVWRCIPCSALRGIGLTVGLQWLAETHMQIHGVPKRTRPRLPGASLESLPRPSAAALLRSPRGRRRVDKPGPVVTRDAGDRSRILRGRATQPPEQPSPRARDDGESDGGLDEDSD